MILDAVSGVLALAGAGFFVAGTVGLLRFPDRDTRIHTLAKADNLGLGLIVLALIAQAPSPAVAAKLTLIWLVALLASSVSSQLLSGGEDTG